MGDLKTRLASLLSEPSTDAPHDQARLGRVERTRVEMMTQGDAIRATLAGEKEAIELILTRLDLSRIRRVVIAGCGDSWFCAIAARPAFERLTGLPTEPVQALDWAAYGSVTAASDTLVVGLSSGGNTPAVMAALRAAKARGAVAVGLSNTPASPVLTEFDGGLTIHATRRGWPTQSSTAAIALLCAFASRLAARLGDARDVVEEFEADLSALPDLMDSVSLALDKPALLAAASLKAARIILFAGAGPHFAAAAFGAAKVKELGPIHAVAMPLEEYHHYRSQKNGDPLFLVAPDAASAERALDTALVSEEVGGHAIALVPHGERVVSERVTTAWHLPPVRMELAPILYSVPLHLFSYHFAKERFEAGLGYPGAFPEGTRT